MFQDSGEDCVFMETAVNLKRIPHMFIECIPLPRHIGDMAPIYFKVDWRFISVSFNKCWNSVGKNSFIVDIKLTDSVVKSLIFHA